MTDLRYADDTTLLVGTKEDLTELVEKVRRASEKAGLYLNVGKPKVITYYRRHRRDDRRWLGYRGSKENRFLGRADYQGRTMPEESAKKYSYGKGRNGRTNVNLEGQRSNAGHEGETSERFGVPDCSIRSGELDDEKTREK